MKNDHIAALTGGISTGKSTVSKYFQEYFGFHLVDADKIGHKVLSLPQTIAQISDEFGPNVIDNETVNRKILGQIVFGDKNKLKKLNEITHPVLIKEAFRVLEKLNDKPVIFEAAILIEAGWHKHFKKIILTTCSPEIQLARTMVRNSLSQEDAQKRINAQVSDRTRSQHSDFIIDTSLGLNPVKAQLDMIANTLLKEIR